MNYTLSAFGVTALKQYTLHSTTESSSKFNCNIKVDSLYRKLY
jgi:hypothetical protein